MSRRPRTKTTLTVTLGAPSPRHRFGVNTLLLGGRGASLLYSAGRDGAVRCWDLCGGDIDDDAARTTLAPPPPPLRATFEAHTDWVTDIVLAADDQLLVSCSHDATLKVWRADCGDDPLLGTLQQHSDYVQALAVAPATNPGFVASVGLDHSIYVWDLEAMRDVARVGPFPDPKEIRGAPDAAHPSSYCLCANSTGSLLITGSSDNVVRGWDVRSGKQVITLQGHTDNVRCVALSGDGTRCVSAGSDASVRLWDLAMQRKVDYCFPHVGGRGNGRAAGGGKSSWRCRRSTQVLRGRGGWLWGGSSWVLLAVWSCAGHAQHWPL